MKQFENIGEKIKKVAVWISKIGMILSIAIGLLMIVACVDAVDEDFIFVVILAAIVIAVLGTVLSRVLAYNQYGFGELIEKTSELAAYAAKADADKSSEK